MRQRGDLPVLDPEPDTPHSALPTTAELASDRASDRTSGMHRLAPVAIASREWMQTLSRSRQRVRGVGALVVVCLVLLLGSAGTVGGATNLRVDKPAPTPLPTATPWPTPTATPLPPPPTSIPPGWEVYRAHHFAVAYPLGWTYLEHIVQDSNAQISEVAITFNSNDGSNSVGIAEREGLDAAALQQYCATPGMHTSLGALSVITSVSAGTLHMYTFVSVAGVAYTLLYPQDEPSPDVVSLYNLIVATFRPEVSTSACG